MIPFNLNLPRMGYFLVFKSPGGFFSNQIVKAQRKRGYGENSVRTHIDVSGGGPYSVAVVAPRAKVVNITKRYKGRYVKIMRYKGADYDRKRYKVAFWAASNCNRRYDWLGVIRFKFGLLLHSKNRFFCSENALWALQKEYPYALKKAPQDCLPADFLNPDHFEMVWEGQIP